MYIVIIAWMYVAVMMAVAEAVAPNGGLLGAITTFIFYGVFPAALLAYILSTPARKARKKAQEAQEAQEAAETHAPPHSNAGEKIKSSD